LGKGLFLASRGIFLCKESFDDFSLINLIQQKSIFTNLLSFLVFLDPPFGILKSDMRLGFALFMTFLFYIWPISF